MAGVERISESLYTYVLEEKVDVDDWVQWFSRSWTQSVWIAVLYVGTVFGAKAYMQSRPAYDLRMPLAIWSSLLAIFSIAGTVRTTPELFDSLRNESMEYTVCNPSYFYEAPSSIWAFIFPFSKVLELGDTLFIVLRKKPLIFLHWYHHITVMIYCFYSYGQLTASARYFMVLNYTVHSFMYSYYALRALSFRIPRWVNMMITMMQLSQMAVGIGINVMAYIYLTRGRTCAVLQENVFWAFLMYASYLVLFAQFFHDAYLKPKSKQPIEDKKTA